jgi:hypothetical protein
VKDKLMVSRDVVFDETKPWNWGGRDSKASREAAAELDIFSVHWEDTVPGPTIGDEAKNPAVNGVEPMSPAASIPASRGADSPRTPSTIGAPV